MKITGFMPKDIFLKDNSCLLKRKFFSGICCLKNNAGKQGSSACFLKNNAGKQGRGTVIFRKNNKDNKNNRDILLTIILKISFFLTFVTSTIFLCFLPAFFNIKEAQALPPSPLMSPMPGEFAVKFRQEYFDESELVTRKHTGVDIAGRPGDAVRASGNGIVAYTGFSVTGGRTVVIRHNDKIRSTYLNILDCFVTRGELLSQGDIIANIGAGDDPSFKEPHLHFGIIYMDSYLDPEDVLNIDYTSITKFIFLEYINPDISMQINRR